MELLTSSVGNIVTALPPFLLVLAIVVFFHELGHYLVGRWCGIKAVVFSVGFGRELFGRTDRHGTRWRVSLIPLGGYVKFLGDENVASMPSGGEAPGLSQAERMQSFPNAALWRRAATIAAGPIANFILAIVIFAFMFGINGKMIADPVVASVQAGSAAQAAGIVAGDRFVAIDGIEVETFDDVQRYVSVRPEVAITITMDRQGELVDLTMIPVRTEVSDRFGNKMEVGRIGVVTNLDAGNFRVREFGPLEAVGEGVSQSWYIVTRTVDYIGNIITGREKPDQLGGPIRVAKYSKDMSTLGLAALIQLAAVLSVSIGLLNLMPIPMLDGGHLVFYAIEAVRGRPPGEVAQEWAYRFGLTVVLALMLFATWNDVTMLIG